MEQSKSHFTQDSMLTFYCPKMPFGLVFHNSPYVVGAVLFYVVNEEERPIAYVSSSLSSLKVVTPTQKRKLWVLCSKLKFLNYLYEREFSTYFDKPPLEGLGLTKPIKQIAAARM